MESIVYSGLLLLVVVLLTAWSSARVRVVTQPETPPDHGPDGPLKQARSALEAVKTDITAIVRRYREKSSPGQEQRPGLAHGSARPGARRVF